MFISFSLQCDPVLDGVKLDTASLHTICEPITNQGLLVEDPCLTFYPLLGHQSPMRGGGPEVFVVGVPMGGEEDGSNKVLPLELDSIGGVVYSTSDSRKTSSDTSASSMETDSGYIHCSTCTYTSLGNGEANLDRRLEAIQEDLELSRLPHLTEEDSGDVCSELLAEGPLEDMSCSSNAAHGILTNTTSENELTLNPKVNIVISETPV